MAQDAASGAHFFAYRPGPAGCACSARTIGSWSEQALVARRQEHFVYRTEAELDFHPYAFQQAAGLTAYYNRTKFHCLAVGWDETLGRSLTILSCEGDFVPKAAHLPAAEVSDPASA